jgi:hypothetical protein
VSNTYPFGLNSPFLEIPWALNAHERLTLEALHYSVAMALYSYERLRVTAKEYSDRNFDQEFELPLRVAILSDAWAVLDTLNKIRDLILKYPAPAISGLPAAKRFVKQSEAVNWIRNQFQHLSEQLRRRVNLVAASDAVFGQVSWILVHDPQDLSRLSLFGVSGGGVSGDDARQHAIKASPIGHAEVEIPVGRFELHAFAKKVNLSAQLVNLKACVSAMEESLRPALRARAERAAQGRNFSAESLLRPGLESSAFRIDIGYGVEGGVSADENVEVVSSMKQPPIIF